MSPEMSTKVPRTGTGVNQNRVLGRVSSQIGYKRYKFDHTWCTHWFPEFEKKESVNCNIPLDVRLITTLRSVLSARISLQTHGHFLNSTRRRPDFLYAITFVQSSPNPHPNPHAQKTPHACIRPTWPNGCYPPHTTLPTYYAVFAKQENT